MTSSKKGSHSSAPHVPVIFPGSEQASIINEWNSQSYTNLGNQNVQQTQENVNDLSNVSETEAAETAVGTAEATVATTPFTTVQ